ncbi:MAG: TonB-dependent receptor [Haliscomenobacter sp.]|nr:TonB-dependent receptor [Haliscomenobacter sp.]
MKKAIIALFLLSLGLSSSAQTLRGKIFGKGETDKEILPGATVAWAGTDIGVAANENGVFEISTQDIADKRLVASYLGFRTDTIRVEGQVYLSIILEPSGVLLNDVVVTGDRPGAFISSLNPVKTEVITQKELTKAACCDLAGCFETQATVQPQTTNVVTNSKELRILGLSGVYNQVLIDGLPLIQGMSYTYGISSFPGTLVDNIFVAKGANSVLQGYESISGQINVEMKTPGKTDKLFLNAYMNSFLEKQFNANLALSAGKKWTTLLALHTVQPANKTDRDEDQFLDLPLLTRYMLYNRWDYGNDQEKGLFSSIGFRWLTEQRIGGQWEFDPDTEGGDATIYGQAVNYQQPEVYAKTGWRFNDDHALTLAASSFFQKQRSYFGTVKYDAEQINAYVNLQHEYLWKESHLLKYGASLRYQNIEEDIRFTFNSLQRGYAGAYNTRQVVPGVFAENAFHWNNDKVVWILGARLDHHQQFGSFFTPRTLLKYRLDDFNTFRASVGMGWRQVNLFSENINLLVSSRDIIFQEAIEPERGLNWGLSYVHRFVKGQVEGVLSADFYQTRFFNQFFLDYDSDPTKAYIRNFTGRSLSNAFQVEASLRFNKTVEFKAAYNYLDVFRVEEGLKNQLPFNPPNRLMAALSYRPKGNQWFFDLNAHWYDKQRLPDTQSNPGVYRTEPFSSPYTLVNGQATFRIGAYEVYGGMENIFDFRQLRPIISWQDPFGPYFDTSSVWGPTRGREIYLGVRWRLN